MKANATKPAKARLPQAPHRAAAASMPLLGLLYDGLAFYEYDDRMQLFAATFCKDGRCRCLVAQDPPPSAAQASMADCQDVRGHRQAVRVDWGATIRRAGSPGGKREGAWAPPP